MTTRAAAAKSRQPRPTLCDPTDGSPPGFRPWDSPGKNTGVGCHFLLQPVQTFSKQKHPLMLCYVSDSQLRNTVLSKTMSTGWEKYNFFFPIPMTLSGIKGEIQGFFEK